MFGIASPDGHRSFVLNRGDDSVTVINMDSNQIDRTIPLNVVQGTHAGPVEADYVASKGKLLVANYDNDTVSIINVQTDMNGNDGPAFGRIVATPKLGSLMPPLAAGCGQLESMQQAPGCSRGVARWEQSLCSESGRWHNWRLRSSRK